MSSKGAEGEGGAVDREGGAGEMLVVPIGVLCIVPCDMLGSRAESVVGSCPRRRLW